MMLKGKVEDNIPLKFTFLTCFFAEIFDHEDKILSDEKSREDYFCYDESSQCYKINLILRGQLAFKVVSITLSDDFTGGYHCSSSWHSKVYVFVK